MDGKEDIASYIERIELYFAANYVEKDKEVVTLLAVIGADAYGVLPFAICWPPSDRKISLLTS